VWRKENGIGQQSLRLLGLLTVVGVEGWGGLRGGKHEAGGVALLRQPIVEEVHRVHPPHGCKYLFIYHYFIQK
jgi:hypothetical protein